MRERSVAVAIALAALIPSPGAAADPEAARFAIVIGNNQAYDPNVVPLRYADDDALATYLLLREAGVEATLLTRQDEASRRLHPVAPDGPPSWPAIAAALARINRRIDDERARGRRAELLFFYSGHGSVAHGEGFVVLESGRLTRSLLRDRLIAVSRAERNHVVIDACKSYFLAFGKGAGGRRERFGRSFVRTGDAELERTGFVLSTSSDRDSHEWERFQAGVFSHQVRSGLRGAADADLDGAVSYAELGAFLTAANRGIANERFRPDFLVRPPGGGRNLGAPVFRWPRSAGGLTVDRSTGRLHVETARGERILDAHPASGQRLVLHVPSARPQFLRTGDETVEYVLDGTAPGPLSRLPAQAPSATRKGALNLAFEELFASPFGAVDVAGYRQGYRDELLLRREPELEAGADRGVTLTRIVGWTAASTAVVGTAAAGLAFARRDAARDANQRDRVRINGQVRRLNATSRVLFGVAGATAATWLVVTLWPEDEQPRAISLIPSEQGITLSWSASW